MSAEYDIHGFYARHFTSETSKRYLLEDTTLRARQYAGLDPERNSDIAFLFVDEQRLNRGTGEWEEGGVYADLLVPATA